MLKNTVQLTNEANVWSIKPTAKTTKAPMMPLTILDLAAPDLAASSPAIMYIIPPQTMKITATTTLIRIKNLATVSIKP